MGINVLVFGMTDNPGGMESCVMNYYRNIDKKEVHFDFLCNWEHMVYADEVMADGSRIYTIPKIVNIPVPAALRALLSFFIYCCTSLERVICN